MNSLIRQFFNIEENKGDVHFREVYFLNEHSNWDWENARKKAPLLSKPWFELSRISPSDRIEFVSALWLDRLPYHPKSYPALVNFFQRLDDIGIVLHRQSEEELFTVEMLYSLADNSSFFRGLPPCRDEEFNLLKAQIPYDLPRDFQDFCHIHHGFGKLSELGMLTIDEIVEERRHVIHSILEANSILRSGGNLIDPHLLIPFYESFGLASYQCFYADWYPASEMGNIYLSGIDYTVSDISDGKAWTENLAFPTFVEWLVYYLEGMSLFI
jgi:hypothetical protein